MKRLLSTILLILPIAAFAQVNDLDASAMLDVLKAPSSPAFNLLGISPSNVERPTDLNAFRLSIQNASSSFTKLPTDYSVEVAPAALAGVGHQTLTYFDSTKFKYVFWQSFSVSAAASQGNREIEGSTDSASFTKLGLGLKFSIVRPRWSNKTSKLYQELQNRQKGVSHGYFRLETDSKELKDLEKAREFNENNESVLPPRRKTIRDSLTTEIGKLKESLHSYTDTAAYVALKKAAEDFKIERIGLSVDFAGGVAFDFPDNSFDYSLVSRGGAWLTGGYEGGNNGISAFAVARYLYQPDKIFADDSNKLKTDNISTFDFGGRLLWTGYDGKFVLSAEGVYRSVLNKSIIDPTWRFTFNTEYDFAPNRKITLAIGKNFDGTVTKSGNLIAALNFIAGFGSAKKIAASATEIPPAPNVNEPEED